MYHQVYFIEENADRMTILFLWPVRAQWRPKISEILLRMRLLRLVSFVFL